LEKGEDDVDDDDDDGDVMASDTKTLTPLHVTICPHVQDSRTLILKPNCIP
jgi:hypothetical protein